MRSLRSILLLPLLLGATGCIKSMLVNGQIEGTRQASVAFDTIGDWELAYKAASSGIVQFEGMHVLAPDNEDALFLLTKAWTGYGFGFVEDEMENAEDAGERELADQHKARAVMAYDRAIKYGLELLAKKASGFDDVRTNEASLDQWLAAYFKDPEDAANLFWIGYAWLARTNLMKDNAEAVANLFVAVSIMKRSVELDPTYNAHSGTVVLAAYHSRTAMAELDRAKELFEDALAKTSRKSLIVQFNYAAKYACAKADAALYTKLMNEVIQAEDPAPELRLTNTIAKRRAKRWLSEKRMFDACSMEPAPAQEVQNDAS